jgi:hypothetical protein
MKNVTTTATGMQLLFEEDVRLTGMVEYGFSINDLIKGRKPIPQSGAHFDISFEGELVGDRIKGTIAGTDYLEVRADGRFFLSLHACIHTADGARIKVIESGINSNGDLKLFMTFYTADERYAWLNREQVIGLGEVDFSTGLAHVKGYRL